MEKENIKEMTDYERYYDSDPDWVSEYCYDKDGNIREFSNYYNRKYFEHVLDTISLFMFDEPFGAEDRKYLVDWCLKYVLSVSMERLDTFRPEVGSSLEALTEIREEFSGWKNDMWAVCVMNEVLDKLNEEREITKELKWKLNYHDLYTSDDEDYDDYFKSIESVKIPDIQYLNFIMMFLSTKEVKRIWDYYFNERKDVEYSNMEEYRLFNEQIWMEDFKYTHTYDRMVNEIAYAVAEICHEHKLLEYINMPGVPDNEIPNELLWRDYM